MPFQPITDAAALRQAVVLGTTSEGRVLEFKGGYGWKAPTHDHRAGEAEELARDVAQFANTDGGVLLVGVTERSVDGRRVADKIAPVDDVAGFKGWAEQAIRNYLTPATFARSMHEIRLEEGTVLAINVAASVHLVALWHDTGKRGIEYLYRTDHGKEWFNPDEVERHIMNGSRAMQIRLVQLVGSLREGHGQVSVAVAPPPKRWVTATASWGAPFQAVILKDNSDHDIELSLNSVSVRIPHGLILDAWITADRRLGLCLKVGITVTDRGGVTLEPIALA